MRYLHAPFLSLSDYQKLVQFNYKPICISNFSVRGGSRIPRRRGCNPPGRVTTYSFPQFQHKLHELEKMLGRRCKTCSNLYLIFLNLNPSFPLIQKLQIGCHLLQDCSLMHERFPFFYPHSYVQYFFLLNNGKIERNDAV